MIQERLRNHDARINANHDSLATLRDRSAAHTTKIGVITTELRETREDIAEMKEDLAEARAEQKDEMTWLRRGMWTAAAALIGFMLTAGGLILSGVNGG